MNNYVTGGAIRTLREQKGYTQKQLAERLLVSEKRCPSGSLAEDCRTSA